MKNYPKKYLADDLKTWDTETKRETPCGGTVWTRSRPYHRYVDIKTRIAMSWGVFTGKYDVLMWRE